jgi:3-(3-hydroxy-phenyl)propionate hydroxylase
MELGGLICITDPEAAAERDRRMMAALTEGAPAEPPPSPRLGSGLLREGDPAAGAMSIQAPVTTTWGSGLFDDVVSPGCLLLASESIDLDQSRSTALADVGLAVVALGEMPSIGVVGDDTGAYRAWLDELQADAVLIRPDFAVHGTAPRGENVTALVDAFLSDLRPTAPVAARVATADAPA